MAAEKESPDAGETDEVKERKRKERLEQNRISARESRKRKKTMIEELQVRLVPRFVCYSLLRLAVACHIIVIVIAYHRSLYKSIQNVDIANDTGVLILNSFCSVLSFHYHEKTRNSMIQTQLYESS